jgi:hypothetical protein
MSLGADNTICKDEYVAAMRARLDALDPPLGANVDDPEVEKNFAALAEALFRILTEKAVIQSNAAEDPAFWQWVASMVVWAQAMKDWQAGLHAAFQNWAPVGGADLAFRTAVLALTPPGAVPAAPTSLGGKIV